MSTSVVSSYSRKKVSGELTRGRETAVQLSLVLRDGDPLPLASGLVGKIFDSFNRSISLLGDSGEISPPAITRKPENSGDNHKDRRGCYKRRRTSETWIKESPTLFEDGHAWRKYRQKVILHAKHPRNYFRCTHKFDEVGCEASKQVQMIRDDPPLYRTTYHGQHTCKNTLFNNSSESPTQVPSSVMWSFGSSSKDNIDDSSAVVNTNVDYFAFNTWQTGLPNAFSSGSVGDVVSSAGVISCTASTRSMEVDLMMDSVFYEFLEFQSL